MSPVMLMIIQWTYDIIILPITRWVISRKDCMYGIIYATFRNKLSIIRTMLEIQSRRLNFNNKSGICLSGCIPFICPIKPYNEAFRSVNVRLVAWSVWGPQIQEAYWKRESQQNVRLGWFHIIIGDTLWIFCEADVQDNTPDGRKCLFLFSELTNASTLCCCHQQRFFLCWSDSRCGGYSA